MRLIFLLGVWNQCLTFEHFGDLQVGIVRNVLGWFIDFLSKVSGVNFWGGNGCWMLVSKLKYIEDSIKFKIKTKKYRIENELVVWNAHLSAELENGQTDWYNEWEEWQLKCVECLDSQDTKTQWNKCDYFQKDESQNWDGDFLQFRFARFNWSIVEFNFEINFVIFQITCWDGDFAVCNWQIHRHIVALNIVCKCVQNVGGWTGFSNSLLQSERIKKNKRNYWNFLFFHENRPKLTGLAKALQAKTANTAEARITDREIMLIKLNVNSTGCDVALPEVN